MDLFISILACILVPVYGGASLTKYNVHTFRWSISYAFQYCRYNSTCTCRCKCVFVQVQMYIYVYAVQIHELMHKMYTCFCAALCCVHAQSIATLYVSSLSQSPKCLRHHQIESYCHPSFKCMMLLMLDTSLTNCVHCHVVRSV